MAVYKYRAEWVRTDANQPPPQGGEWHVRVYDPTTNCIVLCVHHHASDLMEPADCSINLPGTSTPEDIEQAVLDFLAEREADLAACPQAIIGEVRTNGD